MHDGPSKRQRFREAGLWAVDPPSYYQGRFLILNASVPPALSRHLERVGRPTHERRGQRRVRSESAFNIATHRLALMGYLAELRDGLALARALGRILVLPSMLCYCDRLWAGSDNILAAGCMYPGSEGAPFLPFKVNRVRHSRRELQL